ncbi:hypothetical protein ABBQ38_008808 [Trebouxia sp. C0009 RCD-2024]
MSGNVAEAKLAARMFWECPFTSVREQVLASLCQALPAEAFRCGVKMAAQQQLSHGCLRSLLTALVRLAQDGRDLTPFRPLLSGPLCCGLLEAAGRVYGACTHTAGSAAKDSKKSAAEPVSVPALSSAAACIASSKDSEGRLHLATVVNSLLDTVSTEV